MNIQNDASCCSSSDLQEQSLASPNSLVLRNLKIKESQSQSQNATTSANNPAHSPGDSSLFPKYSGCKKKIIKRPYCRCKETKEINEKIVEEISSEVADINKEIEDFYNELGDALNSCLENSQTIAKQQLNWLSQGQEKVIQSLDDILDSRTNKNISELQQLMSQYSLRQPRLIIQQLTELIGEINFFPNKEPIMRTQNILNDDYSRLLKFPLSNGDPQDVEEEEEEGKFLKMENSDKSLEHLSQMVSNLENYQQSEYNSILHSIEIIPSVNYNQSMNSMLVEILQNGQIQLTNNSNQNMHAQCYLQRILLFKVKYVIRVLLCSKGDQEGQENSSSISLGLVERKFKDDYSLVKSKLRFNLLKGRDLKHVVKGYPIHLKGGIPERGIQKFLEFRIHLQNKMFQVCSYPDYNNVSELQKKHRIQKNIAYYFAVNIARKEDSVRIVDFLEVQDFEEIVSE